MIPNKIGQIVIFHSPYPDEDPNQLYVVLEIHLDVEKPRTMVKALGTGLFLPPVITVLVEDLIVVDVSTADLLGHQVTLSKSDNSEATGDVIEVGEQKIDLELNKSGRGIETNVWLTVLDSAGYKHSGYLMVK